jgi:plasmid stability protein
MQPEHTMANITLKNVPDSLYERLKAVAAESRRSLNSEIILRLERSVGAAPVEPEAVLSRVRAVRERLQVPYLTDAELDAAKEEGRP